MRKYFVRVGLLVVAVCISICFGEVGHTWQCHSARLVRLLKLIPEVDPTFPHNITKVVSARLHVMYVAGVRITSCHCVGSAVMFTILCKVIKHDGCLLATE